MYASLISELTECNLWPRIKPNQLLDLLEGIASMISDLKVSRPRSTGNLPPVYYIGLGYRDRHVSCGVHYTTAAKMSCTPCQTQLSKVTTATCNSGTALSFHNSLLLLHRVKIWRCRHHVFESRQAASSCCIGLYTEAASCGMNWDSMLGLIPTVPTNPIMGYNQLHKHPQPTEAGGEYLSHHQTSPSRLSVEHQIRIFLDPSYTLHIHRHMLS